jgi:hypothetical protein
VTCSPTINDDLLEFWPMLEGPGASVAIGEIRGIPLALQRTDRDTNEVLPAGEGWTTETGSARAAYNGAGVAEIEAGLLGIAEIGDGLTLAVRFSPGTSSVSGFAVTRAPIRERCWGCW